MELKIIYDNEAKEGFRSSWGFSCLVGDSLLFDTGADLNTLLYNMYKFCVKFECIDKIVLSHEHRDHTGGFRILEKLGNVEVFIPKSFSKRFKKILNSYFNIFLTEIDEAKEIASNIFTTGEIGNFLKEQSLIVKKDDKLTIITGCSHPGLENILRKASKLGNIYGVVGGFHGFSRLEALREMSLIVPCHCTARKREILTLYPESSMGCSAGCRIKI